MGFLVSDICWDSEASVGDMVTCGRAKASLICVLRVTRRQEGKNHLYQVGSQRDGISHFVKASKDKAVSDGIL